MPDPALIQQIDASIRTWTFSYYLWATVFYILCIVSIVLPLVITAGILSEGGNKVVGIFTAISVALLNWTNLGIIAGNFDQARSDLNLAKVNFPNDAAKLKVAYADAQRLVRSVSPGLPQTSTTGSRGSQQ